MLFFFPIWDSFYLFYLIEFIYIIIYESISKILYKINVIDQMFEKFQIILIH